MTAAYPSLALRFGLKNLLRADCKRRSSMIQFFQHRRNLVPEGMTMAITVYPVTPSFAAEIGDVDLASPIDPTDLRGIKDAFTQYGVLIFPDQHLSQDQ